MKLSLKERKSQRQLLQPKNRNKELEKIEDKISDAKAGLFLANDLILQAQSDLDKALQKKGNNLQRNLLKSANSKLKVGTARKLKFQDDLDNLEKSVRRCFFQRSNCDCFTDHLLV